MPRGFCVSRITVDQPFTRGNGPALTTLRHPSSSRCSRFKSATTTPVRRRHRRRWSRRCASAVCGPLGASGCGHGMSDGGQRCDSHLLIVDLIAHGGVLIRRSRVQDQPPPNMLPNSAVDRHRNVRHGSASSIVFGPALVTRAKLPGAPTGTRGPLARRTVACVHRATTELDAYRSAPNRSAPPRNRCRPRESERPRKTPDSSRSDATRFSGLSCDT
jgi:hypothetical protein